MVTITGLEKRKSADGKEFTVLNLLGSIEVAISKATWKPYLTARKTSIPCTFDEVMAKNLVGQTLAGEIEKMFEVLVIQDVGELTKGLICLVSAVKIDLNLIEVYIIRNKAYFFFNFRVLERK
jgi:hypothetical protein